MEQGLRHYLVVTGGYWAFTVTDGAIRMLVVLYFHQLGYSPFEVAMLFLFYEFFGIVTNLLGGWLGARIGLNLTMHIGMGMQVVALLMLTVPDAWLSVPYVMAAQALSGHALPRGGTRHDIPEFRVGAFQVIVDHSVAVLAGPFHLDFRVDQAAFDHVRRILPPSFQPLAQCRYRGWRHEDVEKTAPHGCILR